MPVTERARELALTAAQAAADKKAQDIVLIDVADQLYITDAFVIASAANERQVGSIVDAVHDAAVAAGVEVLHAPRLWPEYHPGYYAVFLRDLDGHNVEAVHHITSA